MEDGVGGGRFLEMEDGEDTAAVLRNVHVWWNQVQKQVLNSADG